jgi:hypothetical protein
LGILTEEAEACDKQEILIWDLECLKGVKDFAYPLRNTVTSHGVIYTAEMIFPHTTEEIFPRKL